MGPIEREGNEMDIRFLGAAGTVTGSKHLVTEGDTRILVDCGLFQGLKAFRLKNWDAPPVDPGQLDAVALTHAHLDHSGYLPVLIKKGYKGPIYCTEPTRDLCGILLPDSGYLQEEDARYANRKGFSRHDPALPLYTKDDALKSLQSLRAVPFGEDVTVGDLTFRFDPVGHILGAAAIQVRGADRSVLFSGDVGRPGNPLTPLEGGFPPADAVVMETTYGNRLHSDVDPVATIGTILKETVEKGGILLIPAFAVGRSQSVLWCLHQAFEKGLAPQVPVYVNSPMATNVTDLYQKHHVYHRLTNDQCRAVCGVARFTPSVQESKQLNRMEGPAVIISASGMMTGGRILHHVRRFAPNRNNTILLTGYQAPGTRGAALLDGAEELKIHGQYVRIRAKVVQVDFLSAHGDRQELLDWVGALECRGKTVFLVHGEPGSLDEMRRRIEESMGYQVRVPAMDQRFDVP